LQQIGRLATFIEYSCVENNKQLLLFPLCGPLGLVSRSLVKKITTIQLKLRVDQHNNFSFEYNKLGNVRTKKIVARLNNIL
jgi:hypothetical protein